MKKPKSECCLADVVKGTAGDNKKQDICSECYMPCKVVMATKVDPMREPISKEIILYAIVILTSIIITAAIMLFVQSFSKTMAPNYAVQTGK